MDSSPESDPLYLDYILELIALVQSDLEHVSDETFMADRNLSDLTAYRLTTVGEYTRRLSEQLKQRHPEIAWHSIYRMRNIVAHHYHKVNKPLVWDIAWNSLDALAIVCRQELEQKTQ